VRSRLSVSASVSEEIAVGWLGFGNSLGYRGGLIGGDEGLSL
jgi:hypothetical protein